MSALSPTDLSFVVRRIPKDLRQLLSENAPTLYVGGGFIRATIAGETPADIDFFGSSKEALSAIARPLQERRGAGTRVHTTKNAITVITPGRLPVQFITRWLFDDGAAVVESFDFTVCQAVIWREGKSTGAQFTSSCGAGFYPDLAARRLTYTSPQREEEAGGSLMRVLKYLKRGYTIQADSMGAIIARLVAGVRGEIGCEEWTAKVLTGLLREVDPLLVVDGVDPVDEHDDEEAQP